MLAWHAYNGAVLVPAGAFLPAVKRETRTSSVRGTRAGLVKVCCPRNGNQAPAIQ